jgi:Flp pilus assembly pilin Flp
MAEQDKGTAGLRCLVARFARDEAGATAIEYCFIAMLVSISIIFGATGIGKEVANILNNSGVNLKG